MEPPLPEISPPVIKPVPAGAQIEFLKILVLRGPNIWAHSPVIEAWVGLGELANLSSIEMPGFNERLAKWLPSLVEHRCSVGERGGFLERLRRGTYLAHILEHVTLEMQSLAGVDLGFGRARATSKEGIYKIAFKYREETLARECLEAARRLCMAAVRQEPFDMKGTISRLKGVAEQKLLGPSTSAIVRAATARGIPHYRLNQNSLVQFGYGSRSRRIQATETDRTSSIAECIAQDKELTRQLLQAAGIPAATGYPVQTPEGAWAAAEDIGLPVVVKPQDGSQGRGVAVNLSTREQVIAAYETALKVSPAVLVEKYAPGSDHRLLVVGGRFVAAARREPAHVVGDGKHTIKELIDTVNTDPRRGEDHSKVLTKIQLDEVGLNVLKDEGFAPESIPPAGQTVLIRRNANLSTGGTATDVTDSVHPSVAARAIQAAQVIGLDVAGIDILARDISMPLEEQGGIVVEVNAAPGLRMHLSPSAGIPRPVGEAIIDMMFEPGHNGRIPIVAVTGVNGKTTVTRVIAHILKGTGSRIGMTCTDGIFIEDRGIDTGDCSGPVSARNVLMNPNVDAAVLETARGGILRAGLGFDRCAVAVVTNIGTGDHLGLSDIETPERLAAVKRVVVEAVLPEGAAVLNAADPLVVEMATHCPGSVIFFALDPRNPVMRRHRETGGRAVFAQDNTVILASGSREQPLVGLEQVPLTHGGRIGFQVDNVLASAAAAWSLGIPPEVISSRLASFMGNLSQNPARFNILEIKGATVILDYGHNVSALAALIRAINGLPHCFRSVVYTTAGDRRDCDIIEQGRMLGDAFDRVYLYEDHYLRGRPPGEITRLMKEGMKDASRVLEIEEIQGGLKAVELALANAASGELVVVQADTVYETANYIRSYADASVGSLTEPAIDPFRRAPFVHERDDELDERPVLRDADVTHDESSD